MPKIEELGSGIIIVSDLHVQGRTITVMLQSVRTKPLLEYEIFCRWVADQAREAIIREDKGNIEYDLADPYGFPLIISREWYPERLEVCISAQDPLRRVLEQTRQVHEQKTAPTVPSVQVSSQSQGATVSAAVAPARGWRQLWRTITRKSGS